MADSKKYNGSTWQHSLRKLTTATETIENPLYSDGTAITNYTIKGNTVQNGTPTPDNPVDANGVGVRTENLFDAKRFVDTAVPVNGTVSLSGNTIILSPTEQDAYVNRVYSKTQSVLPGERNCCIPVSGETEYTIIMENARKSYVSFIGSDYSCVYGYSQIPRTTPQEPFTFTTPSDCAYIVIRLGNWVPSTSTQIEFPNIMLIEGSTVPDSYIPYGYKIPISSANTTTPVYLGEVETTRRIRKLVLTGGENIFVYSGIGYIRLSDGLGVRIAPYSDKLLGTDAATASMPAFSITQAPSDITPAILAIKADSNFSNANAFKTWLAKNQITVWYVLATPETATVNEPLMKIGNYADTLSNATSIPTTEGANSITVDTTVQPSEFTATWTGWHDASVKEKSENLFDTFDIVGQVPSINTGELVNYAGSTCTPIAIQDGDITITVTNWSITTYLLLYDINMSYIGYLRIDNSNPYYGTAITGYANAKYCRVRIESTSGLGNVKIMLNTGSTALPYEPYWK